MRAMKTRVNLLLLAVAALCGACSGGADRTALPRREGYARVEAYADTFIRADLPVRFEVNSGAQTEVTRRDDGTYWLTATYPRYGASLFCTFTPVASEKEKTEVVSNRLDRISLNIGDAPVDAEQGQAGEMTSYLVTTRSMSATPVQFLIYPDGERGWVASGSVFFPGIRPGASLDSITPMVEAVTADVRHAIATFQP